MNRTNLNGGNTCREFGANVANTMKSIKVTQKHFILPFVSQILIFEQETQTTVVFVIYILAGLKNGCCGQMIASGFLSILNSRPSVVFSQDIHSHEYATHLHFSQI